MNFYAKYTVFIQITAKKKKSLTHFLVKEKVETKQIVSKPWNIYYRILKADFHTYKFFSYFLLQA
jgi:hypothetical protein